MLSIHKDGEGVLGRLYFYHLSPHIPALTSHSLLTQFLVGLGARALGLAGGGVPAVVTLGNLPHVDIHRHSLRVLSSAIRQMQSATFDRQRVSHSKPQRNEWQGSSQQPASSPKAKCFLLHSEDTLTVFSINNLKNSCVRVLLGKHLMCASFIIT